MVMLMMIVNASGVIGDNNNADIRDQVDSTVVVKGNSNWVIAKLC